MCEGCVRDSGLKPLSSSYWTGAAATVFLDARITVTNVAKFETKLRRNALTPVHSSEEEDYLTALAPELACDRGEKIRSTKSALVRTVIHTVDGAEVRLADIFPGLEVTRQYVIRHVSQMDSAVLAQCCGGSLGFPGTVLESRRCW